MGQVLSFAFLKQGIEPLHATTILTGEGAVALMGDCSYGKSCLAAALLQVGHRLLTDDLLILKKQKAGFTAFPGVPRIKLFREVAKRLLGPSAQGVPMNRLTQKLIISLGPERAASGPVPLKTIYVLADAGRRRRRGPVVIRRLSEKQAFLALLRNTFNAAVTEPARLKRQFAHATRVARTVPVKLLSYPRTLAALPAVRDTILADLAR